jgi:hypothetical protein
MLPTILLKAVRTLSVALTVPADAEKPVKALPVTVEAAIAVAPCVPVTSPDNDPVKLPALLVVAWFNVGTIELAINPLLFVSTTVLLPVVPTGSVAPHEVPDTMTGTPEPEGRLPAPQATPASTVLPFASNFTQSFVVVAPADS